MIKKFLSLISFISNPLLLFFLICLGSLVELLSFGSLIPIIYFLSNKSDNNTPEYLNKFIETVSSNFALNFEFQILLLLCVIIIFSFKFLYIIFLTYYQSNFSLNLTIKLMNFFLKNYISYSDKTEKYANTGTLIRNIQTEVSIFVKSVFQPGLIFLLEILILMIAIISLLIFNLKATSILLIFFFILSFSYFFFLKNRFYNWGKVRQYHAGKQFSVILEALNLRNLIKMYNLTDFFSQKLNFHLYEQKKISIKNSLFIVFPRLFLEFIFIFFICLSALFYLFKGYQLDDLFNILIVYAVIAARLFPAVSRIARTFQSISTGKASINVLFREKQRFENLNLSKNQREIKFNKNLRISELNLKIYDKEKNESKSILENASIIISKNKFIGIVGESGIGKTTLINFLSGNLNAESFKVHLDEKIIENSNILKLHNLGIVSQQSMIFDGTIKENLFFNNSPNIDKSELKKITDATNLTNFIESSNLGLETVISEKGENISGGQIQKICIARALNFKPDLLILDEATSALDIDQENHILRSLKKVKNLTCIIISHRKETLLHCDTIYEFKEKKLYQKF